jgi:CBS domain-containing protein
MTIVSQVMTTDPCCVSRGTTLQEAADRMRSLDVGDVLVVEDGRLEGIITDRDITVRAVADGMDVSATTVDEVCSAEPLTAAPDEDVAEVANRMRQGAVRRIPVVEGGRPVGIVSLGDLAIQMDPASALADISEAPPDR